MIQIKGHHPSLPRRCIILFLGMAVLAVQIVIATHTHADGADHSDCPLCLSSGALKSTSINHVVLKKPLQCSWKVFPAKDFFICIYFHGFFYTPCGPPQA